MPKYKKYSKKRFGRRSNYKRVARIAQKVVNQNTETKKKTYVYNAVGIDPIGGSATTFASISYGSSTNIAQLCRGITNGTTLADRTGNQITLRGIYLNMALQCASGAESNNIRVLIIRPKGQYTTSSTSALAQAIFNNVGSSTTQWLNPIDTDAFKVYYDKRFWIVPTDISGVGNVQQRFIKKFIKFKGNGISMKWNVSNSQPDRDFWLVAISDSTAVSHPGMIAGFVKLFFKDA